MCVWCMLHVRVCLLLRGHGAANVHLCILLKFSRRFWQQRRFRRSGKTSLLFQFALNAARTGKRVYFFCQRNKIETAPPLVPAGLLADTDTLNRVHLRRAARQPVSNRACHITTLSAPELSATICGQVPGRRHAAATLVCERAPAAHRSAPSCAGCGRPRRAIRQVCTFLAAESLSDMNSCDFW